MPFRYLKSLQVSADNFGDHFGKGGQKDKALRGTSWQQRLRFKGWQNDLRRERWLNWHVLLHSQLVKKHKGLLQILSSSDRF